MFKYAKTPSDDYVLFVDAKPGPKLCVELGSDLIMKLQPCRDSYQYQIISINKGLHVGLAGDNSTSQTCIGLSTQSDNRTLITYQPTCDTNSTTTPSFNFYPLTISSTFVPPQPFLSSLNITPTPLTISNLCVDSDPSPFSGTLTARKCVDGVPSQLWIHLFGQIRNVETGLCLDVPNADNVNSLTETAGVGLGGCVAEDGVERLSLLWMKNSDGVLVNGKLGNCVRLVKVNETDEVGKVMLGTEFCSEKDSLSAYPKTFTSIPSFTHSLPNRNSTTCKPDTTIIRKDIRDLNSYERTNYFNTVNRLRLIPSYMGRRHLYDDFVALHALVTPYVHGTPMFLPFHRYYLSLFENVLQKVSGISNMGLPYWSWGTNNADWNTVQAGVLTPTLLGTSGLNKTGECVTDGFMNNKWIPNDGQPCLIRAYNPEPSSIPPAKQTPSVTLYSEPYMLLLIKQEPSRKKPYKDYNTFRSHLESTAHNAFHGAIAGPNGYKSQFANPWISFNDPIFVLHHANMDRYWWYFQKLNIGNETLRDGYNGPTRFPADAWFVKEVQASKVDILPGLNVEVSEALSSTTGIYGCVKYYAYSRSVAAVFTELQELMNKSGRRRRRRRSNALPCEKRKDDGWGGMFELESSGGAFEKGESGAGDFRKPSLAPPTALPGTFLEKSRMRINMNVTHIVELQQNAAEQNERLVEKTKSVLGRMYGLTYEEATFEQFAVASKVAIEEIVTEV
ncbi:hypothetical protein HDV05_003291 [Chytridiales sp. JEL 0842]|nr:hypothetical protein HDV05_003291 [Chytridiales sp. JEL 0842]